MVLSFLPTYCIIPNKWLEQIICFQKEVQCMSKKEIDVGYSPESISKMREFFKNNDFTVGISLEHEAEIPAGEARVVRKAKGFFSQYWLKNLPANRKMKHAAYLLNPFEMEAYARMHDLNYLKGPATGWRQYAKMPIKERMKLYNHRL